ncbi:MAG: hypothetical protein GJ680_00610 [Alteromonadaceae bacterium]|nr:hypothetical protein [Alteromonadaceae bacterium]
MGYKKVGLLLGDEEDWPRALEGLARRMGKHYHYQNNSIDVDVERVRIHPFSLQHGTSYSLVIDRLAYWHFTPREWLKKAALMNDLYLLNNPFTFQSMEKHSAYCAMMRLGMNVPETWFLPPKIGPDNKKYGTTASKYHDLFDLPEIAKNIGYPVFMKPFDGGGWRGVTKVDNEAELLAAYDASETELMHVQKGLDNFDVFVRSLGIGPDVRSFKYDPDQPQHLRYVLEDNFIDDETQWEAQVTTKVINAFFRWDFNSCEAIYKDGRLWPMDFANACPDIAITSLHYYFPWAISSLWAWSVFCMVTKRPMHVTMDIRPFIDIADSDRSYKEKLTEYGKLADQHLDTERYWDFRHTALKHLDEVMWEFVRSPEFDNIIVTTVQELFPVHEHEQFINHYRGLLGKWVQDNNR